MSVPYETAIIRDIESFLLELDAGFSFVAQQKRIQIDDEDFHLDLLFYNRQLRLGPLPDTTSVKLTFTCPSQPQG